MDSFATFTLTETHMIIDLSIDNFIKVQPLTQEQVRTKADILLEDAYKINKVCNSKNLRQIVIINLNKGLLFDKFNFKLVGRMLTLMCEAIPNHDILDKIECRNCNKFILAIWDVSRVFIPKYIKQLISIYPD